MAIKNVKVGSFGPFPFDDTQDVGVSTDGDVSANNLVTTGLTTDVRLLKSNANKALEEVATLGDFIAAGGAPISITDNLDGTVTVVFQKGTAVADSTAATLADLVTDFNNLLAVLRSAGVIET